MKSFLKIQSDELYKKVIRKDLLQLNKELTTILRGDGDKTGVYTSISVNAQALILYHMLELIEQQGLDVLLDYLEKLQKDSKKKKSSKAVKMLAGDHRLKKIHIELKKNQEYSPDNLVHPKYQVLEKILLDELNKSPESRILVFVKLRTSVRNIASKLKEKDSIKCKRFVGQTTKSKQDKGLSQKEQIEILNHFKSGKYNVLVSTNVGEEGLDIAECDLVVFYDVVSSEIRLIQRKGRTARRRKGKVIKPYFVFKCNKCAQYIYVNTKQKTKKCLRCNRTHQVKNIREKKIEAEIVLGLTTAVNKIKEMQNTFAIQELGKFPDLRTEKDFHVCKLSKIQDTPHLNKEKELGYSEIIKRVLQKLIKSYLKVPYYLIELAAEKYKIPKNELKIVIIGLERIGFLTKASDGHYEID